MLAREANDIDPTDLHELFAGVLAEERLVLDGLQHVVEHQVSRRNEGTLGVRRVVSQVGRLRKQTLAPLAT